MMQEVPERRAAQVRIKLAITTAAFTALNASRRRRSHRCAAAGIEPRTPDHFLRSFGITLYTVVYRDS